MDNIKSDYRKGLIYFIILILCIFMWFTTPDGDPLFYKLIGLFGLSPGIPIGSNATLYIYMLIPIIAAVVSIRKILRYWQSYGTKFKECSIIFRYLPVFIVIPILLFSNVVTPSLLDRTYYAVISQRSGLQSITCYAPNDHLGYRFVGNSRTYSYDFALGNHSSETVELNIKLIYQDMLGLQEVFIKDDNGEPKVFSLPPKQVTYFMDEFTDYHQTTYDSGNGEGIFSVVLVSGEEQYEPKLLTRIPLF